MMRGRLSPPIMQRGPADAPGAAQLVAPATIHAAFEAQVARNPEAIGVAFGTEKLSYAQLDQRANRLARHLAAQGIGPERVVGLALPRSIDMVVAILAVLKAGAAYLPLDPGQPPQRTAFMLADCGAAYLVAEGETLERLGSLGGTLPPSLRLDDRRMRGWLESLPGQGLGAASGVEMAGPDNLAYVIYTSGSTGAPKGVAVTHRSVVNLAWRPGYVDITPADSVLQFAPFAFDAAVFEVWGALLNGARLVLGPAGRADLNRLAAEMRRHSVTVAWFTAGLFEVVASSALPMLAGLRVLLSGGDILSVAAVSRVQSAYPALRLINGYGPTETTTFACTHSIAATGAASPPIPIGRPIDNARVFILDDSLRPVGVGVAGELYIGGEGLARGYVNRPGLTAERFLACPFGPPGARMYRTGDLARLREDGAIDFLGRSDDQVKIRGVRIEPGEIEAALAAIEGVARATVVPRSIAGDTRLVAYLVPRPGISAPADGALRLALGRRLPDYMIPAAFIWLDVLPLSPNGKLDRARLPLPEARPAGEVLPQGATARRFAEIWQDLLGTGRIDPAADLFALGGDSLMAFAFLAAVDSEFGRGIASDVLLQAPTIERLAEAFDAAANTPGEGRPPGAGAAGLRHSLNLRLVRAATGVSRGVVLGMPGYAGHAAEIGIIARHALHDYDVWTFSADASGRKLTEDGLWLEVARDIANRVLAGEIKQPRALIGFSLGGYLTWLVDRLLVIAGQNPTPVLNFDGDVLHLHYTGWQPRVQALAWQGDAHKAPRMLLLRRAWPTRFAMIEHMETEWAAAGVSPEILRYRTLDHLDIVKPAAIEASREAVAAFIEGGSPGQGLQPEALAFETVGGLVFRLLDDAGPLKRIPVKALVESPKLPQDSTVRLALLVLAVKLGDPRLALGLARRISEVEPSKAATYAKVRFLSELGLDDEASAEADAWCESHPADRDILLRARQEPQRAMPAGAPRQDEDGKSTLQDGEMSGPAQLHGFVDRVGTDAIEGWAQDPAQPEEPVCLDVLIEDVFVTRMLAHGHRADLLASGQGSGCHAFSLRLPFQMSSQQRKSVVVRRTSDHVVVPWTSTAIAAVMDEGAMV